MRPPTRTKQRAADLYRSIGMQPLILSKEIDGFIADRLMEALWREALWLVNDGVATAAEIDDAMRFGPGLRWSFMGTFLTYRIAGGEAGMRHFMEQFGPTLQWPWTKLMDVPELTDELLDTICAQSDAQVDLQAPGMSIRELEALRDDCLVEVIHGLRNRGFAAGKTLADFERALFDRGNRVADDVDLTGPIRIHERVVPTEWVDYNGHTNDSRYMQITSEAGRPVHAPHRRRRGLPRNRAARTTPSRATSTSSPRATPATACTSRPACCHTTPSACTSSPPCTATTTRRSPPPSTSCCTSTPRPARPRRRRPRSKPSSPRSLRTTTCCRSRPGRAAHRPATRLTGDRWRRVGPPAVAAYSAASDYCDVRADRSHVVGVTPRSRSRAFSTFSVGVRGSSSTMSTYRGTM